MKYVVKELHPELAQALEIKTDILYSINASFLKSNLFVPVLIWRMNLNDLKLVCDFHHPPSTSSSPQEDTVFSVKYIINQLEENILCVFSFLLLHHYHSQTILCFQSSDDDWL